MVKLKGAWPPDDADPDGTGGAQTWDTAYIVDIDSTKTVFDLEDLRKMSSELRVLTFDPHTAEHLSSIDGVDLHYSRLISTGSAFPGNDQVSLDPTSGPSAIPARPKSTDPPEAAPTGEKPEPRQSPPSAPPSAEAAAITATADARRSIPSHLKAALNDESDVTRRLLEAHVEEQVSLTRGLAWRAAPDVVLLDLIDEPERHTLAAELLRARAGVTPPNPELHAQSVKLEEQRAAYFTELVTYAKEFTAQRKKWSELAETAKTLLPVTLIVSGALTILVLALIALGRIDGWQAALLVFVLAIAAISPVVLLLLERPLQGIDEFQPGTKAPAAQTKAEPEKPEASGDAKDPAGKTT